MLKTYRSLSQRPSPPAGLGLDHFTDEDRMKAIQGFLMDPHCFERVSGLKERRNLISFTIIEAVFNQTNTNFA